MKHLMMTLTIGALLIGAGAVILLYGVNGDVTHSEKAGEDRHEQPKEGMMTQSEFKKPADEVLREQLTDMQYKVTQKEGTEPPFKNAYWDNKQPGIYVDIVSGEPLFSSIDKFKSGTGWPSFTRPLVESNVTEKADNSFFRKRTEVRSKHADSHLGHVFNDGPPPTGKRYCLNSAALRFIPAEKLEEEGYGEWAELFEEEKD